MLIAFDQGQLSESEIEAVGRWLLTSPGADERLQLLTKDKDDPAADALRQPSGLKDEITSLTYITDKVISRVVGAAQKDADTVVPLGIIREYQLLKELGRGGMGQVYLARHTRLKRNVAIKLLAPELASDKSYRRRFEREMAVLGQLDHPNLVRAADAGAEGDKLFLVMELLDGRDLKTHIALHGLPTVADACEAVRQAAQGLHNAHQAGMVHRDIKPGNLFLTSSGVVKVIDLGVARVFDSKLTGNQVSTFRTVLGTPDFMSPEQWDSTAVDHRADIYSLGCTLYFLLTGRPPFHGEGKDIWLLLLEAHRQSPPPSARAQRPEVPAELDELIQRMMAKAATQRPASALEVAEALAPFCHGHNLPVLLGGRAKTVGDVTPLVASRQKTSSRRSYGLGVTAVGIVFALGVGLTLWFMRGSPATTGTSPSLAAATAATAPASSIVLQPSKTLRGHAGGVISLAYSPNGKVLASGSQDKTILLWDTATWKASEAIKGHSGDVFCVAFSPDGRKLASVTSERDSCAVRLWEVETAKSAGTISAPWPGLYAVAWLSDGRTVVTGGWDNELSFWDVSTGVRLRVKSNVCQRFVRALSVSPDGKMIATGGTGRTRLWDAKTGEEIPSQLPEEMCPTFMPPKGEELAGWSYGVGRVTLCPVPAGPIRVVWRAHPQTIEGLAVSPDGRFVASLGKEGVAKVWSTVDATEVATLRGHQGTVYFAAFTPDGAHLATGGADDCTICIWDLPPIFHVRK
jgi:serine/threonine protein kinase